MSEQINYQEMRFDSHPTQQMVDACCARIAELEVKLTLAKPVYSRRQLEAEVEKYKWLAEHDLAMISPEGGVKGPDPGGGFAVERRLGFILTRLSRCYAEHEAKP